MDQHILQGNLLMEVSLACYCTILFWCLVSSLWHIWISMFLLQKNDSFRHSFFVVPKGHLRTKHLLQYCSSQELCANDKFVALLRFKLLLVTSESDFCEGFTFSCFIYSNFRVKSFYFVMTEILFLTDESL